MFYNNTLFLNKNKINKIKKTKIDFLDRESLSVYTYFEHVFLEREREMADGVRRTARALYDRARLKEKMEAAQMFENLDTNSDGKISLREFINGVVSDLSNVKVFKQLDSDDDGALDFDDVLVLFYCTNNTIKILRCDGCRDLLLGPSFSCFECLSDGGFALCSDCYGSGIFPHRHPLLHDRALLIELCKTKDRAKVIN